MKELRTMIRRLRTTTRGFLDDGADVAEQLLLRIENKLDRNDPEDKILLETLQEAAECFESQPSKELLMRLRACKDALLKRCNPLSMR